MKVKVKLISEVKVFRVQSLASSEQVAVLQFDEIQHAVDEELNSNKVTVMGLLKKNEANNTWR